MEQKINTQDRFYHFAAFLLGLSVSEGITVLFTVGSTSFVFAELLAPVIFMLLFITNGNSFLQMLKSIPLGFKIFFVLIIISFIPGMFYFELSELLPRYTVGLIYLLIAFTMAADVFMLREYRRFIIKGIFWGYCLNIVFSLFCFLSFRAGNVISLSTFIHRNAFYIPRLSFRSQGFFLEPSHFIRYICTVLLVLISSVELKHSISKIVLIFISIVVMLVSYSGNIVILLSGAIVYFVLRQHNGTKRIKGSSIALSGVIVVTAIIFIMSGYATEIADLVQNGFHRIFMGTKITDSENAYRYYSMTSIVDYIKNNGIIFGCGWNMTGTVLKISGINSISAFSDMLEMALETGIFSIAVYFMSSVSLAIRLIKKKTNYSISLAISIIMILFLQIGTDYAFNTCIMLIFGLSIGELADRKDNEICEKE